MNRLQRKQLADMLKRLNILHAQVAVMTKTLKTLASYAKDLMNEEDDKLNNVPESLCESDLYYNLDNSVNTLSDFVDSLNEVKDTVDELNNSIECLTYHEAFEL